MAEKSFSSLGTTVAAQYAPLTSEDQLIRHNNCIHGSNIWNTAWQNRTLVQNHAFWEIKEGESALFWQDSWQQLKPLDSLEDLADLKRALHQHTPLKVKDFGQHKTRSNNGVAGKPHIKSSAFQKLSICSIGKPTPPTGKSDIKKGLTSCAGGTPRRVSSPSRRPTQYRGINRNQKKRLSGARFGIRLYGPKSPPFFGYWRTTEP